MISTFSYDDFNHWNAYASCLPDGRKNCVKAKYVATILLIFLVTTITMVLSILLSSLHTKNIDYTYILYTMVGEIFGTILVLSIMYPIIYKFGIERARIIIFIMVFGIGILGGFLLNFIDVANILNLFSFLKNDWVITLILSSLLLLYISCQISLKIQQKKEF